LAAVRISSALLHSGPIITASNEHHVRGADIMLSYNIEIPEPEFHLTGLSRQLSCKQALAAQEED
jgi:hypothetical protein